jgi:phosphatidylserine/phosphatidylglycerophosphate/cardiolipin synthase-like enzyme
VPAVNPDGWFLTAAERGNEATTVDVRVAGRAAWTTGNRVRPLVHGAAYFAELFGAIRELDPGDHLFFTDWRGDPDERLAGPGTEVATVLADAARRGVLVRGLLWRSHLDAVKLHERENRFLGEQVQAAGGECLLDMRVRSGGSHHQKLVVLRHRARPDRDVAYVGGIDLCHGRKDDGDHRGDEQPCPLGAAYGRLPAWHDVQVAVQGPAVVDLERTFRERWEDPGPLTRSPYRRWRDRVLRPRGPAPCPAPLPGPAPCGTDAVQVLRTFPYRRRGYAFAPAGERSIARAHLKALANARRLIYLEDQYIWSSKVISAFADALTERPELRLIAVLPHHPDRDSALYNAPQLYARAEVMTLLRRAGGDRVAFYGIENAAGTPVYVHAKVTVIDDLWCTVGSDNLNLRSWTYDSEISCAVLEQSGAADCLARRLRLSLFREHLDRGDADDEGLTDAAEAFAAFARSAARLQAWHDGGRQGPRPPGRLRPYALPRLSPVTRWWSAAAYRHLYDPDGRPPGLRRAALF